MAKKTENATIEQEVKVQDAPIVTATQATDAPAKVAKKEDDKDMDARRKFGDAAVDVSLLLKNNSEIRRFTSRHILNHLEKEGKTGAKRYVSFMYDKFAVKIDGLTSEYSFSEPFFLEALVASFASFANSAQRTINTYTQSIMSVGVEKAVDTEKVAEMVADLESQQ